MVPNIQNFWDKVKKTKSCWHWTAYKDHYGYGIISYKRKHYPAHRFSYIINIGKIPKGKIVCHTCDNPSCVNPKHLWIGTDRDNSDDKVKKRRQWRPVGESHPTAKLTESLVKEIMASSISHKEAAIKYGISYSHISNIRSRRAWKHLKSYSK